MLGHFVVPCSQGRHKDATKTPQRQHISLAFNGISGIYGRASYQHDGNIILTSCNILLTSGIFNVFRGDISRALVPILNSIKHFFIFPTLSLQVFLVACTRLFNPLCRSVRRSVRPSVRQSVRHTLLFCIFGVFGLTTPAQMIW